MAGHQWMQSLRDTSVCPKCHKYSLQRSTVHNKYEDFRKRHASARPYRCHECGWRGWLKENDLTYPSTKELMELRKDTLTSEAFRPISLNYTFDPNEDIRHHVQSDDGMQNPSIDASPVSGTDAAEQTVPINPVQEQSVPDSKTGESSNFDFIFPAERKFADQLTSRSDRGHRGLGRTCPVCGETALHRSHSRGFLEYLKKKFSSKRPYRCNKCMWRGWLERV